MLKTIKVRDLIKKLQSFNEDLDVYLSSDQEGKYLTIDDDMSFESMENKKALVIYPYAEGIDYDELEDNYNQRSE